MADSDIMIAYVNARVNFGKELAQLNLKEAWAATEKTGELPSPDTDVFLLLILSQKDKPTAMQELNKLQRFIEETNPRNKTTLLRTLSVLKTTSIAYFRTL